MRRDQASHTHDHSHVVVLDIETIVPHPPAEVGSGFAKWPHHQPLVASLLTATLVREGEYEFELDSLVCEPGREAEFYEAVDARIPPHGTLVGFNSGGFDLPVLALGAMAAKHFDATALSGQHRAYRFGRLHADLAELFSNYGATPRPSLVEVCGRLGIPVKLTTHGSEVADLHAQGRTGEIIDYCESDVAATYAAWLHWVAWRDGKDALLAEPLSQFARWIEASPAHKHLLSVAGCEPAHWAHDRTRVLAAERSRRKAERQAERQRIEREFEEEGALISY